MSIFINQSETINVKFFIALGNDGHTIYADKDKEVIIKEKNVNQNTIKEHQAIFYRPSYKNEVDILAGAMNTSGEADGSIRLNFAAISYKRFITLLKEWTLTDDNGQPIPATKENVDRLHPAVARSIISALDELI